MSNLFLMPSEFENLNKEELIHAFFGTYYETVIVLHDEKLVNDIIDFIRTSLKCTKTSNSMLWKHMWLCYCLFIMQRMKYYYCCECIKKERINLEETHDNDFIKFIATVNVASKVLSKGNAILEAPRFVDTLIYNNHLPIECKDLYEHKNDVVKFANEYKNMIVFKSEYLNKNKYVNVGEFVFDGLIILKTGFEINPGSIYNCFESVLKLDDSSAFKDFCEKLYNIIK